MTKEEGGNAKPVMNEKQVHVFSKTWDCATFLYLPEGKEMLMPGEDASMTLEMIKPMALEKDQVFTVMDGSSTIGTGKVTELKPNMTEAQEYLTANKKKKMKAANLVTHTRLVPDVFRPI